MNKQNAIVNLENQRLSGNLIYEEVHGGEYH